MKKIKTFYRSLTTKIKTFYSTNRTQKLAISAVATTAVAGAVAFALLSTPVISPLMSNISDGAIFTKDAEKDKISKDDTKKDEAKDETKKDESKDESKKDDVKEDTGTTVNEDSTAPESTPNTKPSNNKPSSNQTAHTHDWQPNMITIPGTPPVYRTEHILGETKQVIYYTWPDGCKVKGTDYGGKGGSAAADAEHTAKHGQMEIGSVTETVTIEPQVIQTLIQEEVPAHQEQRGWKCSCGATKN